ncbi:chemotaxis protein CheB [uncultured Ilyobacter sp.]|uniref:chemotaxis protein CheB n=1 Tax=uncultured Ilyobacter sp. TaxID=544433 RepID=UPI0029C08B38|nr:chemotaxis protein CheB [uncultured Ilyobacter sp.]
MQENNQYYVCIGASAGGLEALESFFKSMPNDSGLIFIVIQHLSPDYKSLMSELLARYTDMKIQVIEDGMETQPNQVYLIPPRKNLSIFHGKLFLSEQENKGHVNLPIDIFLKSLAKDQNKKAIGIILSGTGSDGTIGVRAIKEAGGMVMVQSETSAKFDGMPKSSISTGLSDYILSPSEMPEELINFIKHPNIKSILNRALDSNEKFDDITKISLIMKEFGGIDFSYYKENTILRRLDRRVKINKLNNLQEYTCLLRESDKEKEILQREFLIGVTTFFRDKSAFKRLETDVLPNINYSKGVVRIWSAACSTGEEVYSLAILFSEYIKKNNLSCEIKLFATDVDTRALEIASRGYYLESVVADIDIELVEKYFIKHEDGYQISDSIRKMVVFAKHNILKDPPFSKLDLLVCRNLFIYIKSEHQKAILTNFYFSLNSQGYMFIGSSETIGELGNAFTTIDSKWKIYKCKEGYKTKLTNEVTIGNDRGLQLADHRLDPKFHHVTLKTEKLLSSIIEKVAPPSIIIDSEDNIIQVINDVSSVIKMQSGKFSNNFHSNMSKEMALFMNNIIRRLKTESGEVIFSNIIFKENSDRLYTLIGRHILSNNQSFYMVSFITNERDESKDKLVEINMSEEVKMRVKELESELQLAQEGLQATIEELETSNEELQSSNEELIASNEELQSTNEELQSVNEELYTVNSEYQSKIGELIDLNNDLNNLIRNTEMGALYLDEKLYIRKVTPIVTNVTNIMNSDIGRSIKHIAVMENYSELLRDVEVVVDTLRPIEKEIQDNDGAYWLIRIRPYRTEYNAVTGIILTFVNIDQLKTIQKEHNLVSERLNRALNIGNMAYWSFDVETGHIDFSSSKSKMLGYEKDDFPTDIEVRNQLIHPEDIEKIEKAIENCKNGVSESWDITYRIKRKDGRYAVHHDHGIINAYHEDKTVKSIIGIITDISDYTYNLCEGKAYE